MGGLFWGCYPSIQLVSLLLPKLVPRRLRKLVRTAGVEPARGTAHLAALEYLRAGGESQVLNCGYGKGFSVLEVIAAVKRVSGSNFTLRFGERRPGDPAALVAEAHRISEVLGWRPAYADLDGIVRNALAWERCLLHDRE